MKDMLVPAMLFALSAILFLCAIFGAAFLWEAHHDLASLFTFVSLGFCAIIAFSEASEANN